MKTLILIVFIATKACSTYAQNLPGEDLRKNEVRLNTLYQFGGYPEVSYERQLGIGSAVGATFGARIDVVKRNYVDDLITFDYAVLPYYRFYFGKKPTAGFFLEGNGIIFSRISKYEDRNELGAGLGIGLGAKFPIKNNWNVGFVVGGGYNLLQEPCINESICFPDVYPRLGITIGKRF